MTLLITTNGCVQEKAAIGVRKGAKKKGGRDQNFVLKNRDGFQAAKTYFLISSNSTSLKFPSGMFHSGKKNYNWGFF